MKVAESKAYEASLLKTKSKSKDDEERKTNDIKKGS